LGPGEQWEVDTKASAVIHGGGGDEDDDADEDGDGVFNRFFLENYYFINLFKMDFINY
jgi:hypothetical protein